MAFRDLQLQIMVLAIVVWVLVGNSKAPLIWGFFYLHPIFEFIFILEVFVMYTVYVKVYRYELDGGFDCFDNGVIAVFDHFAQHEVEAKNAEEAKDMVADYYFNNGIQWHTYLVTEKDPELDNQEFPVWQETTSYDW